MKQFDYVRPATVAEAVAAAAQPGAAYLAAGTNLLDLMKGGVSRPDRLVDVTHLAGLDRSSISPMAACASARWCAMPISRMIAEFRKVLSGRRRSAAVRRVGAAAQCRDRRRQSAAADALRLFLRHRQPPATSASPAAGCDARDGENRMHAVLGWSENCIATHPSDFCVPLVALDAVVEIEGRDGRREIALEELHRLPGDTPERETALEPGDLIVAVRLPPAARGFAAHARYLKVRERTSYAFAVVSAAAALRIENGKIAEARLALGGVAAKPWRARAAEDVLKGVAPTADAFQRSRQARARRRKTVRRQRLQDRARAPHRRARADPCRSRNARAHSRAAGLPLLLRRLEPSMP